MSTYRLNIPESIVEADRRVSGRYFLGSNYGALHETRREALWNDLDGSLSIVVAAGCQAARADVHRRAERASNSTRAGSASGIGNSRRAVGES
jgi:hypothetical protein